MEIPKIKEDESLAMWRERLAREFNLDYKMQELIREVSVTSYIRGTDVMLVVLKDGTMMTKPDGSPMTKQEAIATNILNLAMKGDVKAAQYIQNIQMRAKIMKKK